MKVSIEFIESVLIEWNTVIHNNKTDQSFLKAKTPVIKIVSVIAGNKLQNPNIHQNSKQSQTSVMKYESEIHAMLCVIEA